MSILNIHVSFFTGFLFGADLRQKLVFSLLVKTEN